MHVCISQEELWEIPLVMCCAKQSDKRYCDVYSVGVGMPFPLHALFGRHHCTPAMPCHAMPYHVPCGAMPYHVMPCHAVPCRAVPCCAMPCRAMPCHAMPHVCRAIPAINKYTTVYLLKATEEDLWVETICLVSC